MSEAFLKKRKVVDKERIKIKLKMLKPEVDAIYLMIHCYTKGLSFEHCWWGA